jgi:hypothetical protein
MPQDDHRDHGRDGASAQSQTGSPVTNADITISDSGLQRPIRETSPFSAPGSLGHSKKQFLSGKPIRYYRPKGSQIRHLMTRDFRASTPDGCQACAIFADQMLDVENRRLA